MTFRSFLYALAAFLGDVNAVKKNRVPRRIARRVAGRFTGRLLAKGVPLTERIEPMFAGLCRKCGRVHVGHVDPACPFCVKSLRDFRKTWAPQFHSRIDGHQLMGKTGEIEEIHV